MMLVLIFLKHQKQGSSAPAFELMQPSPLTAL